MQQNPDQYAEMAALRQLIDRDALVAMFEQCLTGVIAVDLDDHTILAANPTARRVIGLGLRELARKRIEDLLPLADPRRLGKILQRLKSRTAVPNRIRARLNLGKNQVVCLLIHVVSGNNPTILVHFSDETSHHRARQRALAAQTQLQMAIESLADGFVHYDRDDRLVICNETYRKFYPRSAHMMQPGVTFREILCAGLAAGEYLDAIGREEEWLEERLAAHRRSEQTVEQRLADGRWLRIVERVTPDGGRAGLRIDISELKQQQERLRQMAQTDELTGLRNRRDLGSDLLDWTERLPQGQTLAVFHLDLHRFKMINSAYGYEAGDQVLRQCAETLQKEVADGGLAARIGGNEFLIALPIQKSDDPVPILLDMQDRISAGFAVDGQLLNCATSGGIAIVDRSGLPHLSILQDAEIALRDAKDNGTTVSLFDPGMRNRVDTVNDMTRELRAAIEKGEFEAHFQPQMDARYGCVIGFETLMRWNHPTRGCLAAGAFLDTAQRSGLTGALDTLAMEQACAAWRSLADLGRPDLHISINLSVEQLGDPFLLDRLHGAQERYGVPVNRLRMELLESTLLDDHAKRYLANIQGLVDAGFDVELDDFGTGHAAIASLRRFKVSRIKIDRSFVRHVDTDKELQDLTGAIVGLAEKLGIETLAEGVETRAEQDFLLQLGCDHAQGWLYSKAIPSSAFERFLDSLPAP